MPYLKLVSALGIAITILLSACNAPQPESQDTFLTFGTIVDVKIVGPTATPARKIFDSVEKDLEYLNYAFHPWRSGPMGRTNQLLAAAGEFTANPSVLPLITQARALSLQSQGYFNPAIGHLMQLWGYHDEFPPEGPPPPAGEIQTWLDKKPSMSDITINGVRMANRNPAVKLDMGGIAKGLALDTIVKNLRDSGVSGAIVNMGGDLKVLGTRNGKPWSIGIRDPRGQGAEDILASIEINDGEAIVTSGDYERFYEYQGKRYHHIIDPFTGYPADKSTSVTVIDKNGAKADAAATALFVAGPEKWPQIAKDMGLTYVMLVDKQGNIQMTPQMQQRIKLQKDTAKPQIVALP